MKSGGQICPVAGLHSLAKGIAWAKRAGKLEVKPLTMEEKVANTNGKAARKKVGGNRHTLKRGGRAKRKGDASYAKKVARWRAMDKN